MNLFDFDIKQISETDPRNLGSIQWRQNWKRARPDGRAHFVLSSRSLERARHVTFLLPAVVSERLVGFGHLLEIFALLDRRSDGVRCIEKFVRQALRH